MINLPTRVLLFISSYAPLGALYFLLYVGHDNLVAFVALGIAATSSLLLWLLLRLWQRDVAVTSDIVLESRKPGAEVMAYIATYLLPFLGFSLTSLRNLAILALYLVILGYLYVTTDMLRVNPTLNIVLRYGVYEVALREHGSVWLIARGDVRRGRHILVAALESNLVIERKSK